VDFLCKTFNYSILPINQQITIKNDYIDEKQMAKKLNSPHRRVCVGVVIHSVTVAVSVAVAVSVTVAIANPHFFQNPFS
jgi:hypothetical protein